MTKKERDKKKTNKTKKSKKIFQSKFQNMNVQYEWNFKLKINNFKVNQESNIQNKESAIYHEWTNGQVELMCIFSVAIKNKKNNENEHKNFI